MVQLVVGALLGGLLGYFARSAEFRQDQQLTVYAEFLERFDAYVLTEKLIRIWFDRDEYEQPQPQTLQEVVAFSNDARQAFNVTAMRLRLISGRRTDSQAASMFNWLSDPNGATALRRLQGEESIAKATEGGELVNAFVKAARPDLVGWPVHTWEAAGRKGRKAVGRLTRWRQGDQVGN